MSIIINIIEGVVLAEATLGAYIYFSMAKEGKKIKEKYNTNYKIDEAILNGPYRTASTKPVDVGYNGVVPPKEKDVVEWLYNGKHGGRLNGRMEEWKNIGRIV